MSQNKGMARLRDQKFMEQVTVYLANGQKVEGKLCVPDEDEGTILLLTPKEARIVVVEIAQIAAYEMKIM